MSEARTQILDHEQVKQIIRRMAFQVYERNFSEKELILAGISGRGETIASLLADTLKEICPLKIRVLSISLDKEDPSEHNVQLSENEKLKGKTVILVDDVLNTGRTLIYALLPFVKEKAMKIQTAILVDRNHKLFPVSADYIGTSLSTTLKEHISVEIEKKKVNVFLS